MSLSSFTKSITKNLVPAGAGALTGFALGGPAGAVIGAGAGLGLGYMQDQQVKAQNKANQRAVDRANAYDMYTWDLANQYNNPKAQAQRLIDAGFNPYTQGAIDAGNASSTAGSNGVAQQSVANKVAQGMQIAQAGANIANTNASTALLEAQARIADNNGIISDFERDYAQSEYDSFVETGITPDTWKQGGLRLGDRALKSATGKDALTWIKTGIDWFRNQ